MSKPAAPGLVAQLRQRLAAEAGACKTCGHPTRSTREMAREIGSSAATVWRFLSGKAPSAELVDKLYARYFR